MRKSQACTEPDASKCSKKTNWCTSNNDCENGSHCDQFFCRKDNDKNNRAAGEFCTAQSQCEGYCDQNVCKEKSKACTEPNVSKCSKTLNWCGSDDDCETDAHCLNYTCRPDDKVSSRPNLQYCTADDQCLSELCTDGSCKSKSTVCTEPDASQCSKTKNWCGSDDDCENGSHCDQYFCRKNNGVTNRAAGEFCTDQAQCTGYCETYACKDKSKACTEPKASSCSKKDNWCSSDNECAQGSHCDQYYCRLDNTTIHRAIGEYCTDKAQCTASFCNSNTCSNVPPPCSIFNIGQCWDNAKGMLYNVALALIGILVLIVAGPVILPALVDSVVSIFQSFLNRKTISQPKT